jgi:hypothetical protein
MGSKVKTFAVVFGALVLLNYARPKLEAQAWFPAAAKRADGIGLDDALDALVILGVMWAAHKYV